MVSHDGTCQSWDNNSLRLILGGLTRDRKAIKHKLNPGYTPLVGSTVKICITCIKSPDEFYANIPEISARNMCGSLNVLKEKINEIDLVKQYTPFIGVPGISN